MKKAVIFSIVLIILIFISIKCSIGFPDPTPEKPLIGCIITYNEAGNKLFEKVLIVGDDGFGNWLIIYCDKLEKDWKNSTEVIRIEKKKVYLIGCKSFNDIFNQERLR